MTSIVFKDYDELSEKTAAMIAEIIGKKPGALLCFPAGETSLGTFRHLAELNRKGAVSFRDCYIVGLDEWVNIGNMHNENCFSFLKRHLFDHIDYSPEHLCFFNGENKDIEEECRKTDSFIRDHGPIDMMLLGAGMNGHLGLNEPGTPFNLYSHVVNLDETTREVGQKYFSRHAELTKGITLGISHIMEAKTVILQLSGARKRDVAKKVLEYEVSPAFPASVIKSHDNSFLVMDREAAGNM
jgi:glucosamine-6-phosphate isomerase